MSDGGRNLSGRKSEFEYFDFFNFKLRDELYIFCDCDVTRTSNNLNFLVISGVTIPRLQVG